MMRKILRVGLPLLVAMIATLLAARATSSGASERRYAVVETVRAVAAGTVLTAADLTRAEVPYVGAGDLTDPAAAVGQVTTVALAAGEVVRQEDLRPVSASGLAYQLASGERALTLGLTPVEAVGYQLAAGARVDALLVLPSTPGVPGSPFAKVLVQDLRVLAVAPPSAGATGGEVTLAVTPKEASQLLLAQALGSVTLVLRAHGDTGNAPAETKAGELGP
jgi:Flp pilus assembly protein CpaB